MHCRGDAVGNLASGEREEVVLSVAPERFDGNVQRRECGEALPTHGARHDVPPDHDEVRSLRTNLGEYRFEGCIRRAASDPDFGAVCDDHLFVKPTEGGRAFIGDVTEAPRYPGARPSFGIDDRVEDGGRLSELVRITVRELPPPKKKSKTKG